jgi:hypothetical protein
MTEITIQIDDSTSDKVSYSAVGFLKLENNDREATPAGTGVSARLGKITDYVRTIFRIELSKLATLSPTKKSKA